MNYRCKYYDANGGRTQTAGTSEKVTFPYKQTHI